MEDDLPKEFTMIKQFEIHGTKRDGFTFLINSCDMEVAMAEVEALNPFSARLCYWVGDKVKFSMTRTSDKMWQFHTPETKW